MQLSIEYIAGLFDGEGYITVNKNKKAFVPVVGIKMNGFNLLKNLNNEFGGYFYQIKNTLLKQLNYNKLFYNSILKGSYLF